MLRLRADFTEERGPVEASLRRKAETNWVRDGISEGFRSAEPERVAPGDVEAVEPRHCAHLANSACIPLFPLTPPAAADACIIAPGLDFFLKVAREDRCRR